MGTAEAQQSDEEGGEGSSELILTTQNVQGEKMDHSREVKVRGSCFGRRTLASSLAGTCSPGGRSCAWRGSSWPRR